MIATTFLRQEESVEATELTEIPRNTEIHVWNEVTNNYVEITYQLNGTEYQGYITKDELENNTELVSGEVTYEHISFINDMVEVLAERWDADPDSVYKFLNNETNLVNTYILNNCSKVITEKAAHKDGFSHSPNVDGSFGNRTSSKLSNGPFRPERWSFVYSTFSSTSFSISFLA